MMFVPIHKRSPEAGKNADLFNRGLYLAVDPGKITGLAEWGPNQPFSSWERPFLDAIDDVAAMLDMNMVKHVICESYVITASTLRKGREENWSMESIGALRWLCHIANVPFTLQPPSEGLFFAGPPYKKLKAIGWYEASKGNHQADASAHLLTWMAKHKMVSEEFLEKMAEGE